MKNNVLGDSANKSLEVVKLLLILAYKWEKREFIENLNQIIKDLTLSLTDEEKNEFLTKVKELGLIVEK